MALGKKVLPPHKFANLPQTKRDPHAKGVDFDLVGGFL
jgi:hypothetical protein